MVFLPKLLPLPQVVMSTTIGAKAFNAKDFPETFVKTFCGPTDTSNWLIPSRILISAYPGDLDRKKAVQKIKTFLEHNITTFVCLQERSELKRFKPYWDIVEAENKNAKQIIFEIEDMGVADEESVDVFTNELVSLYNQGENMLIHCWGGHGRSGYIAAIVLGKLYNLTPQEALRRVQAAHDCRSGGIKSTSPQHYTQFQQVVSILKKHQSKM